MGLPLSGLRSSSGCLVSRGEFTHPSVQPRRESLCCAGPGESRKDILSVMSGGVMTRVTLRRGVAWSRNQCCSGSWREPTWENMHLDALPSVAQNPIPGGFKIEQAVGENWGEYLLQLGTGKRFVRGM